MKNEIDYLRLAMDESSGMFAWHFFGVVEYCSRDDSTAPDPQTAARKYLATFHSEALAEAEKKSEIPLETL